MKHFLDTEFIEGFKKPFRNLPTIGNFNKPYHCIQLISIGLVTIDGSRQYTAICNEFDINDASDWVLENVIAKLKAWVPKHIGDEGEEIPGRYVYGMDAVKRVGKSKKQIAKEIMRFTDGECPAFYADYCAYDWVVFCSLFGKMIDLPEGYPMYCRDLKQTFDEVAMDYFREVAGGSPDYDASVACLKKHPDYPKQDPETEHIAICDALHNRAVYRFLQERRYEISVGRTRRCVFVESRRCGNTIRQADWYIQELFTKGIIRVNDHSHRTQGDRRLFRILMDRLAREHNVDEFDFNVNERTIAFKTYKNAIGKVNA